MRASKGVSDRVEGWLARIPGIRTYRAREHARETDKQLREHLASRLLDSKALLKRLTLDLSQRGLMEPLDEIDRLSSHIQQAADTIRYASYGYGGIFDLTKIRDQELERLYEFDLSLMDDLDAVHAEVLELRPDIPPDQWNARIRETEERMDGLDRRFLERKEFMSRPA
jgi:hypothetical protein